jgi:hypothetical protein
MIFQSITNTMNINAILIWLSLNKFDAYCPVNVFNIVNFLWESSEMNLVGVVSVILLIYGPI